MHKDGGDWYFYDVNFRQTLQNYDTLGVMLTKYSIHEL
jgi:hypothetical protein